MCCRPLKRSEIDAEVVPLLQEVVLVMRWVVLVRKHGLAADRSCLAANRICLSSLREVALARDGRGRLAAEGCCPFC